MKNSTINQLKKIKENYLLLVFFAGVIFSIFTYLHQTLNKIDDLQETIKTTQQMSLKAVIWNDNIPAGERATACDVYISAGYNSLTKKECNHVLEIAYKEERRD